MSSSSSSAPLIVRLPQESGLMLVGYAVGLEYRIVIAGRTLTVLYLHRVVDLLLTSVVCWKIHLINIPPKSCKLQRIIMEIKVTTIIHIHTQIISSSLLTQLSL